MLALGSLAFAAPWLLTALAALPVIWWLLRVTPPAPRRDLVSGDSAAARADPARGDAGAHAVVADPAAHGRGGADHPRAGASAAQSARGASRRRAAGPRHRRRLGGGARLGPPADRSDRYSRRGRPREPPGRSLSRRPLSRRARRCRRSPRSAPATPAPRYRRCSRSRGRADRKAALDRLQAMRLPQGTASVWISDGVEHHPAGGNQIDRANRQGKPTRGKPGGRRRSRGVPRRARHAALCRGRRGRCAAPAAARIGRPRAEHEGIRRRRAVAAGRAAAPGDGAGQRRGRGAARARNRDDRTGREPGRAAPADAGRAAQPGCPGRDRGRGVGRGRGADRRILAPPSGRHRRLRRARAASRCSARTTISSVRSPRSPNSAAASRPTC